MGVKEEEEGRLGQTTTGAGNDKEDRPGWATTRRMTFRGEEG